MHNLKSLSLFSLEQEFDTVRSLCLLPGSWDDVFKVSVGLYLVGTVVWNLFSTGEKIIE